MDVNSLMASLEDSISRYASSENADPKILKELNADRIGAQEAISKGGTWRSVVLGRSVWEWLPYPEDVVEVMGRLERAIDRQQLK